MLNQLSKGDIVRKLLVDYRDRQQSGEVKVYQYNTEWNRSESAISSLFIEATSRIDAVIKLYDHFETVKSVVDGYKSLAEEFPDIMNSSDQIIDELIKNLFNDNGIIWLFESKMPVIIK